MMPNEEAIKKQAKAIMDEFVKALDKIGTVKESEANVEATRKARPAKSEPDFMARMLANAPKKDKDHVIAEKKNW